MRTSMSFVKYGMQNDQHSHCQHMKKNITIFYSHLVNCKIKFIKNNLTFDVIAIWMRKYN
jgi:hypothetical protein